MAPPLGNPKRKSFQLDPRPGALPPDLEHSTSSNFATTPLDVSRQTLNHDHSVRPSYQARSWSVRGFVPTASLRDAVGLNQQSHDSI